MRVRCINAGIGGNKVGDMLERVGDDVIAHNPDWVTVSVGINDVWHGINGTPIDVFKEKYDELIRRLMDQTEEMCIRDRDDGCGMDSTARACRICCSHGGRRAVFGVVRAAGDTSVLDG